jgi:hypothetical protein
MSGKERMYRGSSFLAIAEADPAVIDGAFTMRLYSDVVATLPDLKPFKP